MNRNRFTYPMCWLPAIGLMLAPVAGCGPRLSSPEFGTILHAIPKVQGTEKPFPMPELDEPNAAKDVTSASETSPDPSESSTADSNSTEPAAPAAADTTEPATAPDTSEPTDSASEPEPKQDARQTDPAPESPE